MKNQKAIGHPPEPVDLVANIAVLVIALLNLVTHSNAGD